MADRFVGLTDLFEVRCKMCGSTDVDLMVDSCKECGNTIEACCNKCKAVYKYHDFKKIKV